MCLDLGIPYNQFVIYSLSLLILMLHHCFCQIYSPYYYDESLRGDHQEDYDGYGDGAYHFSEYTLDGYDNDKQAFECYTCHFSKRRGHEHGMANCDDPFNKEGIPTITCNGLCAKTKTFIADGEYMLIRSCLPNCKDMADTIATVECCHGSKCNGSKVMTMLVVANLTVCSFVLILGVAFCCIM